MVPSKGFRMLPYLLSFTTERKTYSYELQLSPPQRPLCIVGRLLCCGEAGEKEKESARGTHRPPRAFYFCRLLIF